MNNYNIYQEDIGSITLALVDYLMARYPLLAGIDINEDVLFEQIDNVLNEFFDYPDYRNYN